MSGVRHPLTLTGVLLAVGSVAVLALMGVPIGAGALLAVVVAVQSWAGAMLWRAMAPDSGPAITLGLGIALGTLMSVTAGVAVKSLLGANWGWMIPPVLALVLVLTVRRRRRAVRGQSWDPPTLTAVAIGLGLGLLGLLWGLRNYPLTWTGTWSGYHTDMPFFEALATSLARLGPSDSIFLPGGEVRYHWLAYAWAGQVAEVVQPEPFVVLTRLLPLVSLMACVLVVAGWTRRLVAEAWAPTVAVLLVTTGGFVGAAYGNVLNLDSPSQAMGAVWLLAFAVALLVYLGPPGGLSAGQHVAWLAVLALLGAGLTGGKVSAAAPALAGAGLVAAIGGIRRDEWRGRAGLALAAAVLGAAATFVWMLAGSNGGGGLTVGSWVDKFSSQQGLNPVDGILGVQLGTGILVIAVASRWVGILGLWGDARWRWHPLTVLAWGMALASLLALILFNGFNEIWFAVAASAPLAVASTVGVTVCVGYLAPDRGSVRLVAWFAVLGTMVFALVSLLWATGASGGNVFVGTLRWTAPFAAIALSLVLAMLLTTAWRRHLSWLAVIAAAIVILQASAVPARFLGAATGQVGALQNGMRNEWFSFGRAPSVRDRDERVVTQWSSGQMEAAAWLRAHAGDHDLLATNLTFGPFVPGVTGMRTYVSAIQYQAPYGRPADVGRLLARENEVWDFIETPSAQTFAPLCREGVRWFWIDPESTQVRDWEPYARVVLANDSVIILERAAASCG